MKHFKLLLLFIVFNSSAISQIVINEYSCSNLEGYTDSFGKYEDWIELYNTSNSSVDIQGYYLSDNPSKPTKWQFPAGAETIIPAHGYLIVFASNRDTVFNSNFHTNFTLKQTQTPSEKIILSNPSGVVIENVSISLTQRGHSRGRKSDGSTFWTVFTTPTPKANNGNSLIYEYAGKPVFSLAPGFYATSVNVSITSNENNSTIRYTLDGTEPNSNSTIYTTPISITSTKVLKAKVFSSDNSILPGLIEFGTYFINTEHSLVVVSIAADDLTELANGDGFLLPFGTVEYYGKDKLLKTSSYGEFNKHGQDSWACDQRSLDFISRDELGYNHSLIEQIFPLSDRTEFQRVIFRASGDDNYPCANNYSNEGSAHMRDGYIQNLTKRGGLNLDVRSSERIIIYLNGEYWGVYEIRENPDEHDYTKYYYDQDKYHLQYILVWGNTWAEYGGDQALYDWYQLYDFIMNNDMTIQENYDYVISKFNYKSLVDYILVNSFTVCTDWLNWNTGWWRGTDPKGEHKKWGYILWDNDATFDFYINYTGVPDVSADALPCNPDQMTQYYDDPENHLQILNKLNTNSDFHQYYVNRQADLLNTAFNKDTMLQYFDEYRALITPEMENHAQRWYGTYSGWLQNTNTLRDFIEERGDALHGGVASCYNLTGPYDLTVDVDNDNIANVKVNSIEISEFPYTGKYFGDINTSFELIPIDTSVVKFENWSSVNHSFSPDTESLYVTLNLTEIDTVFAHFSITNSIYENKETTSNIKVFPTAVTDFINVEYYLSEPSTVDIELYNTLGQSIGKLIPTANYSKGGNYNTRLFFNSSELSPGIYLLNVSIGNKQESFKIVYMGN